MLGLPLSPHSFYEYVVVSLLVLFLVVRFGHEILKLGHGVLDFLRDYRDFRDGY
jgi:hypothetical protein